MRTRSLFNISRITDIYVYCFLGLSLLGLDRNITMVMEETDVYQCACQPDFNCLENKNFCNTTRGVGVSHCSPQGGIAQGKGRLRVTATQPKNLDLKNNVYHLQKFFN